MDSVSVSHPLDNHFWHTLNSFQRPFAQGTALALAYPPDVLPGVAVVDHSPAALADLLQLIPSGEERFLFKRQSLDDFPGGTIEGSYHFSQMLCEGLIPTPDAPVEIVTLTSDDVPQIIELVDAAQPGPFYARMLELGAYYGIRDGDRLVAVAGQRAHLPGYCEVSLVGTHPDYRRRGYAAALVSRIAGEIEARGERAFLHVVADNVAAVQLYQRLGFRHRETIQAIVIRH